MVRFLFDLVFYSLFCGLAPALRRRCLACIIKMIRGYVPGHVVPCVNTFSRTLTAGNDKARVEARQSEMLTYREWSYEVVNKRSSDLRPASRIHRFILHSKVMLHRNYGVRKSRRRGMWCFLEIPLGTMFKRRNLPEKSI